ncbi:Gp138 family membrane-puncturing spike protein [Acinetobacter sp. V91_7]|uniref:Gp138 family membrane-puncturing spike protein n=1 Tax=unclassified Acinetobacter TaxID=196816 RepID=UPI00287C6C0B|nr:MULTISPECIES: Gp138 family membrane-puncturing spike protein [unclassified Acinetobacter]MDS7935676.1 Gp138 family membrane-puncturing spike protein [Acinetobacter sp. V91_4B]MDS7964716.1 Gp138 family membrane-puncturing spike protein [Acinetobacter sp. V91_7]MDS8025589.1 Gp138 family membrane-puncturing spike protein [Acinetobacter sp. V91_13]
MDLNEDLMLFSVDQCKGAEQELSIIMNLVGKIQTVTLVKVISVQIPEDGMMGTVSVQPMVAQVSGAKTIIEHGEISNIPYFRLQGGKNAIVLDPEKDDIGMCGFCSRDISAIKRTKQPAAPNTKRQFDWSDGLYMGGYLNGKPEQYIQFLADAIKIHSPYKIILDSPEVEVTGGLTAKGIIKSLTDVMAKAISVIKHVHKGVTKGGDNTGESI